MLKLFLTSELSVYKKGENMHECITADLSSEYAERWNNEELLNLI